MDPEELKAFEKLKDDATKAVGEIRAIIEESKGKDPDPLDVEKMDKLQSSVDSFEEANQKLVADISAEQKAREEDKEAYEAKLKEFETQLLRLPNGDLKEAKDTPEFKAFEMAIIHGVEAKDHLTEEELKYLRTDSDANGGYLVPDAQVTMIDKNIVEISPIRNFAKVVKTNQRSLPIPIRNTLLSSNMTGEGEASSDSQSQWELVEVYAKKITAETATSMEQIQDSAFDVEALINSDIAEEFARQEGAQFVNGTGADNEITGYMVDSAVPEINSGIADDIEFDNFLDLTDIKQGYNLTYAFNRATLIRAQKLKNGNGDYLWQPNAQAGKPAMINGLPYFVAQDMAAIGVGTYPIICGDFAKGYLVLDRIGIAIVRDHLTQASNGIIRFIAHKRVGGKVVKGEAFKKLKVSV